ncbi:MAG: hypothetical protein HC767_05355 [Akkermansiaceae bacterium]|nr:hypothetical protein [Akkermansiaceae bacterium]
MQNSRLVDELHAREQNIRQLREESRNLRVELQEQVALLSEFEVRFRQQSESAQREIDSLRAQQSQTDLSTGKNNQSRNVPGGDGEAESALLAEAEQAVKVLATEKVQLLEAYELLEEDTGRLIDEAVDKQQKQISKLEEELKVRARLLPPWFAGCSGHQCCCVSPCLTGTVWLTTPCLQ